MTEEFDPFAGSTGLADNIDVTFTECRFVRDPGYVDSDSGEMMPVFAADLATDDPDVGTLENQFFSIGKGWDIEDGGAKVVRPEGKKAGFNVSTYLQQIIAKLLELDEAAVRGRYEETGLTPQQAAYWEGLRVHMEQTEYTIGGWGNVEKKTKTRLMPTEVYGWGEAEEKPAAKPAPAKKAAAKKAPAKKKAATVEDEPAVELSEYAKAKSQVDTEIVDQIVSIAAEAEDDDEFITRCYAEVDGLDEDDNAMFLVDNVDAEDSIWAEAVAAAG